MMSNLLLAEGESKYLLVLGAIAVVFLLLFVMFVAKYANLWIQAFFVCAPTSPCGT